MFVLVSPSSTCPVFFLFSPLTCAALSEGYGVYLFGVGSMVYIVLPSDRWLANAFRVCDRARRPRSAHATECLAWVDFFIALGGFMLGVLGW